MRAKRARKSEIELRVNMLYFNASEANRKNFEIELSRAKRAENFWKFLHFSPKF